MHTRTRRVATALLMGCVFGGGMSPPLGAHEGHNEAEHAVLPTVVATEIAATKATAATSAVAAAALSCPPTISCGFRCTAELGSGFCVRLIRGGTGNTVGPSFGFTCMACDCMYIAAGPNGSVLLRKVHAGCSGWFDGLNLF